MILLQKKIVDKRYNSNIYRKIVIILYNYVWMKHYIIIVNLANILSGYYTLSRDLLVACYEKIIKEVVSHITVKRYLNFTTNEHLI